MRRCCWARRAIFGLQIEQLEEEREAHRNEVSRHLATICDRVDTGLVTVVRVLTEAHMGAVRTPCGHWCSHLNEGIRGNLR